MKKCSWLSPDCFFANEHNMASIKMREALGFQPRGRAKEIRGV
ncbi:hypothetical protein [Sinomonas albida]|nr:hypothetical protein [Sinomonas albida]